MDTQQYETRKQIDEKVIKTYQYGSRVYESHTRDSDYDFIVVVESDNDDLYYSVDLEKANFTVYSEGMFLKRLKEHHISILECIFQHEKDHYRDEYFKLDLPSLRRAISSVSSNSYVKCKKKIKQGDLYIGQKSMFHSIRILMFGIQIARYGRIVDYSCANVFHKMIMDMTTWEDIDRQFKPFFNALKTSFRKLAPLEGECE